MTIYVGRNEFIQENSIHETIITMTNCLNYI